MNAHESAAMWKLYGRSNEGICIQSTYSKLKRCFVAEERVFAGIVKYIDYETEHIRDGLNLFSPFMHKRISFAHEREVRAVILRHPKSEDDANTLDLSVETIEHGTLVEVDLDVLVERIYVAPDAPAWFKELVGSVLRKYGKEFELIDSALATNRPVF